MQTIYHVVMEMIYLSETEKALLLSLNAGNGFNLKGINEKEIGLAAIKLRDCGFIKAIVNYDTIIDAGILTKGQVYIKENKGLENPVDENELKRLQKDSLEYQLTIRGQQDRIRNLEEQIKTIELLKGYWWVLLICLGIGTYIGTLLDKWIQ